MRKNYIAIILTFCSLQLFSSFSAIPTIEKTNHPVALQKRINKIPLSIEKRFGYLSYENWSSYTVFVQISGYTDTNEPHYQELTLEVGSDSFYVPDGVYTFTLTSYFVEIRVTINSTPKTGWECVFEDVTVSSDEPSIEVVNN